MLEEQLRQEWLAQRHATPISAALRFAPDGLVLGAGTVIVAAEFKRRLNDQPSGQARVLALLSAAYGRAVAPKVLGHIERAVRCWCDGDGCLAYIHLAHAGLPELPEPEKSAHRLFLADRVMEAGVSPRTVVQALGLGAGYLATMDKLYNPDQPRVPAGSGRISGQWTRVLSFLAGLAPDLAEGLSRFGAGLMLGASADAVAAFGLLFIPSPNDVRVEGDVSGMPGLHYAWNRDESQLHLSYDDAEGGHQEFTATLQDKVFRDVSGRVVGRVLPDGSIVVDTAAVSANLTQGDQPRLCPAPGPDKFGSAIGRAYEDFVKPLINPGNPTPSGMGYQLPNPNDGGKLVYFEDCQHVSGTLFEIKGNYAWALGTKIQEEIDNDFLEQSARQIAASDGRQIVWVFADGPTAEHARTLFAGAGGGRDRIGIVVIPWIRSSP